MNERERLIELLKDNQGDSTYYMTDEAVQSVSDVLLENGNVANNIMEIARIKKQAKSEAIKEFAERLKRT